jgi:hypothetical protein
LQQPGKIAGIGERLFHKLFARPLGSRQQTILGLLIDGFILRR